MVVARTELVREHRYFEQVGLCLCLSVVFAGQWPLLHRKLEFVFGDVFDCCKVVRAGMLSGCAAVLPLHPPGWLSKQISLDARLQ